MLVGEINQNSYFSDISSDEENYSDGEEDEMDLDEVVENVEVLVRHLS